MAAGRTVQGPERPGKCGAGKRRQRGIGAGDDFRREALREGQMFFAVVQLGENLHERGCALVGGQIDVTDKLGFGMTGEIRKDPADVVARQAVQQNGFLHGIDERGDAGDFGCAVREPAGHRQPAVAQPAGVARFFQRAVERRIRQRIQGHGKRRGNHLVGEFRPRSVRSPRVQQEQRRQQPGEAFAQRRGHRAGRGIVGDRDGGAEKFRPPSGRIAGFEPQPRGAAVRRDLQHKTGVRGAGPVQEFFIEPRLWQAVQTEKGPVIHPGPEVGNKAVFAGKNPAGQPRGPGGKVPVRGMNFHGRLPAGGFGHGRSVDERGRAPGRTRVDMDNPANWAAAVAGQPSGGEYPGRFEAARPAGRAEFRAGTGLKNH